MNLFFNNLLGFLKEFIKWFWQLSLVKKLVAIIVLIAIIYFGYIKIFTQNTNKAQYQTTTVERGSLIKSVSASGSVTSGNSATVSTTIGGIVDNVLVKVGDTVSKGQTIATITLDQDSQQRSAATYATYLTTQNNLNSAKAKMNSLQSALFKANQAFMKDRGVANPTTDQKADPVYIEENADWLQAESDYNNQQGVINAAQAQLTSAWLSYIQTSPNIIAPADGVVSTLNMSRGMQIVVQNSGSGSNSNSITPTILGNITLPSGTQQAKVNVSEVDVPNVKIGQSVTLTLDAFADKTYTGKVLAIDTTGSVSSGVTTYPATIGFDSSPDNMYQNMSVSATIITSIKNDVLLVQSSAVQTQNGQAIVRVLKNGNVQSVPVETGDSNDTQTEITSGLSEGDEVITNSVTTSTTRATTSPFGTGGFGIFRAGGGGGGGNAVFRRGQ